MLNEVLKGDSGKRKRKNPEKNPLFCTLNIVLRFEAS